MTHELGRRALLAAGAGLAASRVAAKAPLPRVVDPPGGASGAEEWRQLPIAAYGHKQDDICFVDEQTGWYGNGAGRVYGTRDGGDSWSLLWEHPGTFVRAVGFIDAKRGFMGNVGVDYYPDVSDRQPLYETQDGGRTWSPVAAPGLDAVAGICGIDVLPVRRIFQGESRTEHLIHAAGRVGGPTAIMQSADGGRTWRVSDLSKQAGMILDVKFLNPEVGFLAASGVDPDGAGEAMILRTADGGRTWRPVYTSGRRQENVWKMNWPTPLIGYGTVQSYDKSPANSRRLIVKTTDGGLTWREHLVRSAAGAQAFGVGFVDADHGWVGYNDTGFETRDGGRSWRAVPMGRAVNKIRIVRGAARTRVFALGVDLHRLDLPRANASPSRSAV